ncbi:hypothetical protein C9974_00585 [Marinobacter sp. B9-2]|nr:hypothetical protein C9974_00585 [Marinobacter sp. B9-2]
MANLVSIWPLNDAITTGLVFALCGLIFGTATCFSQEATIYVTPPLYLFLALIVALTMSVIANDYAIEAAWRWYLIYFVFCIFLILGVSELKAINSDRFNKILAASLWFFSFLYCSLSILKYYGILSFIIPWVEVSDSRLSGIWNQPNLTTTTAWMGIVGASIALSGRKWSFWFFVSVAVFGWVIICAASRMSWLIFIGLACLVVVSSLPKYRVGDVQYARKALLLSLLMIAILFLAVPQINDSLRSVLVSHGVIENNISVALIDRAVTQDVARLSEIAKFNEALGNLTFKQWILGFGPGNYPSFSFNAELSLPPENLASSTWLHSHNLFTMVFVEFGAFGLIVLATFLYFLVRKVLKKPFDSRSFFSVAVFGILFVHSNLEYPLWYSWFLAISCLILVNLFDVKTVKSDSLIFKRTVGFLIIGMTVMLLLNVGSQYLQIIRVAVNPDRGENEYQSLVVLANDSLMGPYAILRKYRDFAPEKINLDWQLREAQRMKGWQPRDLVLLREFSVLVLKGDVNQACKVAESTAYRYPRSAPIMLEHALRSGVLSPQQTIRLASCIEDGLAPRGETIPSIQERNQRSLSRM